MQVELKEIYDYCDTLQSLFEEAYKAFNNGNLEVYDVLYQIINKGHQTKNFSEWFLKQKKSDELYNK